MLQKSPIKTTNYSLFKFRNDNRDGGVKRAHVHKIKTSIRQRNLLEFMPIVVNDQFEIIDGQHRCVAAKELGLPIYYVIQPNFKIADIPLFNVQKNWGMADFMNYYIKNNYAEYLKLENFMKKEGITITTALRLLKGNTDQTKDDFKNGKFVMPDDDIVQEVELCRLTMGYLSKIVGTKSWHKSSKLWSALLILFKHGNFEAETWFKNLEKNINKFIQCISVEDYTEMLVRIYNYRNKNSIELNVQYN